MLQGYQTRLLLQLLLLWLLLPLPKSAKNAKATTYLLLLQAVVLQAGVAPPVGVAGQAWALKAVGVALGAAHC
jgi:hypothetical protein